MGILPSKEFYQGYTTTKKNSFDVIIFVAANCHDANLLGPFVCTSERFYLLPKGVASPFLESCLHGRRKLWSPGGGHLILLRGIIPSLSDEYLIENKKKRTQSMFLID